MQASSWKEQELLDERLAEVEAQRVGAGATATHDVPESRAA